jgi:hypothetical protein
MSDRLDRIRAVVTRAKQNLRDFELGLKAFYDSTPYEVRHKIDPQAPKRIYYLAKLTPVPFELTAIARDVIHNLRSPLDHIADALVSDARAGAPPNWVVYYPISGSASNYPATRRGKIKGVRQEIIDAIDATEPYKGGKGHALWQLNELDKLGKHRDLLSAAVVEDGVDLKSMFKEISTVMPDWFLDTGPGIFLRGATPRPLNVGDTIRIESLDMKVDNNRRFSFAVTLHHPGIIEREPALVALQNFTNLVDNIITTLGPFLS